MRTMKHALLVDDEPEICQLLRNMLQRSGTQCDIAHSVKEGRKALKYGHYDAVFVDVHLPDGLGYDLFSDVRSGSPTTCLIAISAIDAEGERAVAEGADLFVPKPFNRSIIMSSIHDLGFKA